MPQNHSNFWQQHPGLNWSNPAAPDHAYIRAALLAPRFQTLLDIAVEFGIPALRREWEILRDTPSPAVDRARSAVERCLANIEEGASATASRN